MRIVAIVLGLLVAAAMAGPAPAQQTDNMLGLAYSTFLDRPGWERFDIAKVEADSQAKLADAGAAGRMSPIEKALIYVDAMEPPLGKSRTLLRYGQVGAVSFIEVDRYNLSTSEVPHVAWRFNFEPAGEVAAQLKNALRREIPADEATATDCLIAECLENKASTEGSFAWKAGEAPQGGWAPAYAKAAESGHAVSAFAAAEMSVALNIAGVEGDKFVWRGPEQPEGMTDGSPFLFFLDDRGIPDEGRNDAIMGMIRLNDHALAEMWTRRMDDGATVGWQNAVVGRSGAP